MSSQTFQVRADTTLPVDRSIFNLSAVGSESMVESDLGLVPAKSLTTQHRLKEHRGLFVDIEWIELGRSNNGDIYDAIEAVALK